MAGETVEPMHPRARRRDRAVGYALCLALLGVALYAVNLDDYFISDDFDLIVSFHGKPPSYFLKLLVDNESGEVWRSLGIASEFGKGYLRPLKIWLLKLDLTLWGTDPIGYHVVSTSIFVGNLLMLFLIVRLVQPDRPGVAFFAGAAAAMHPMFAEIVPFITAREEILASLLSLAAIHAFLRYRRAAGSPVWFPLLYALAVLSKESALSTIAIVAGYDLVWGHLVLRSWRSVVKLSSVYVPAAALTAAYMALRWAAFGNFKGGEFQPTHFSDPWAFLDFHARFFRSLVAPTMFSLGHLGVARWTMLSLAVLGVVALLLRLQRIDGELRRQLLFFGPVWYLTSTIILYGAYFAPRHNVLPTLGLALVLPLALHTLATTRGVRLTPARAGAGLIVLAALLLPPAVRTSLDFDAASETNEALRARIELEGARVPDGGSLVVEGVPQWEMSPWYFGWALQSALQRPFTPSDLANRVLVANRRNIRLNRYRFRMPEEPDATLVLDRDQWIPPGQRERMELRRARNEWTLVGR